MKENILASKEDIVNLRADMEKGFRNNLTWLVGIMLSCFGIALALMKMH